MSSQPKIDDALREAIILRPDVILDDTDVMHALVAANERSMGGNVVDMRGLAMERLEARLDRLEDTHRSVIAAAYENLAGTNQVHRAVLRLLDAHEFEAFLNDLKGPVAEILRVDAIRLVLESAQSDNNPTIAKFDGVLSISPPGYTDAYLTLGRAMQVRQVTLRQIQGSDPAVYGTRSDWIRSEALLKLDFGAGRLPGMLALGSEDPHTFSPQQGTDLLTFFSGVFERQMRRWLG